MIGRLCVGAAALEFFPHHAYLAGGHIHHAFAHIAMRHEKALGG